jgi:hypothetical protein
MEEACKSIQWSPHFQRFHDGQEKVCCTIKGSSKFKSL